MAEIIDGKAVAEAVRDEVRAGVAEFRADPDRPGLATVLVGDDAASAIYVRSKRKACAEVGMASFAHELPATTSAGGSCSTWCDELNARRDVHGILVQLPLPAAHRRRARSSTASRPTRTSTACTRSARRVWSRA